MKQKAKSGKENKEKLVQAVGVRAVEMDGKARNWWQKFKDKFRRAKP